MSNTGTSSGWGSNSGGPDKVDMSLDDIIRLNKKEQQTQRKGVRNIRPLLNGRSGQGKGVASRAGAPIHRGGGVTRGGVRLGGPGRRFPLPVGRHRGQGVITGLAARKTATRQKDIRPLNRPPVNQLFQKNPFVQAWPFIQSNEAQYRQTESQRMLYGQTNMQRGPNTTHRPAQLQRRPFPPAHQIQREARQATFLSRRGLKVHAEIQKPAAPPSPDRTGQWRTSTNSSRILTVSIDNPTARTQPEPPNTWALHPPPPSPSPVKMDVAEEKKPPKGVPLQFDINSVARPQTAMTLNERFRILKDQRTATAQTGKGSRFVTVG